MHAYKQTNNGKRRWHAKRFSSQSAMEYLMTYGWAILIIAVVLAALFELGVFNPYTFAAKAQPGSCSVYRPDGAGTNNFISLLGPCTNEIPQYAASFSGQNNGVITYPIIIPNTTTAFTISLWIHVPNTPNLAGKSILLVGETSNSIADGIFGLSFDNFPFLYFGFECAGNDGSTVINQGEWYNIVGVFKSGYGSTYVNSINKTSGSFSLNTAPGASSSSFTMGNGATCSYASPNPFEGYMSNVQVYNTALSQSNVAALYKEGIGGVPIDLNNLVGWWPLNGNANDYSGNGYNGNIHNVSFTSGWYKGYTAP